MRVGIVYLGRRGPGGPISLELARHLSRKTEAFAVVSQNGDYYGTWQKTGMDLISVPTFRSDSGALASLLSVRRLRSLSQLISAKRPDVLIWPMVHPWTPFLQWHLRQTPHVVMIHDVVPHPGLKHKASSIWEAISARRAVRCVVMSSRFVQDLHVKGVPLDAIDVIPHGILSGYGNGFRRKGNAPDGPATILFFGRITAYKGLDVLLRAFSTLVAQRRDLHLNIVGSGDMRPYNALVKDHPNVQIVNRWVDDGEIAGFFQSAFLTVLPYTTASQSGVIPLAASFATPVVATTVGALPDQILHGETGLLVPPNSPDDLAKAMSSLLDNPELAGQLGRRLAEQTSKTGDWDQIAEAFLDSCRKACELQKNPTGIQNA